MDDPEFQYTTEGAENVFTININLEDNTSYYWRVDTLRDGDLYTGDIWMFRT